MTRPEVTRAPHTDNILADFLLTKAYFSLLTREQRKGNYPIFPYRRITEITRDQKKIIAKLCSRDLEEAFPGLYSYEYNEKPMTILSDDVDMEFNNLLLPVGMYQIALPPEVRNAPDWVAGPW